MGKKRSTLADTTKMVLEVIKGKGCYFICQVYVHVYPQLNGQLINEYSNMFISD